MKSIRHVAIFAGEWRRTGDYIKNQRPTRVAGLHARHSRNARHLILRRRVKWRVLAAGFQDGKNERKSDESLPTRRERATDCRDTGEPHDYPTPLPDPGLPRAYPWGIV
jgi:hypothetical protein